MASEVGRYPGLLTTQWALVCFSVAVLYVIVIGLVSVNLFILDIFSF